MNEQEYENKLNELKSLQQEYENELIELKSIQSRLSQKQNKIEDRIAFLEQNKPADETNAWKPKKNELYHFIDASGNIFQSKWLSVPDEDDKYSISNVFRTKNEATFKVKQLKVIQELKQFACDVKPNKTHWHLSYNLKTGTITYIQTRNWKASHLYFASKEQAVKAVETIGKERIKNYYLKVKNNSQY